MKKLMIALSAVALAVSANAATTAWKMSQGTGGYLYDGYKLSDTPAASYEESGIQALVFCVAADLHSQEDLVKAFRGDNFKLTDYTTEKVGKTTNASGKLTAANGVAFTREDADIGSDYSYFEATIVTYNDKQYLYVSDLSDPATALDKEATSAFTVDPSDTSVLYKGTGDYSGAGWYAAAAVPEPTSGLLLLLGVAGLALRRRRA